MIDQPFAGARIVSRGRACSWGIPILYVPLLMITHVIAFYMLARPRSKVRT